MSDPLHEIVLAQKRGEARGIASICSAHPWVLKSCLCGAEPVLVEATCNQVNQYGGYTGMTPADFVHFVRGIAAENGLPAERLILGGDHLGPSPWQDHPVELAMSQAVKMVQDYVLAGFTKIHLDASMRLGEDDPTRPLDPELEARRTARLAKVAEETFAKVPQRTQELKYVIGSEVPIPGGATEHKENIEVTNVEDARRTLEVMQTAFVEAKLEPAWERVIAFVVQPGVEFGDKFIFDYDPDAARELARYSETTPFIYEVHSTDYQTRENLRNLVHDHFAILKVGPALTFAFRQAVFALAMMESELLPLARRSRLIETLEAAMQHEPVHWKKYYHGDERELAFARKYSLSDRARYYWRDKGVQAALTKLMANLDEVSLPLSLINQFMPEIYPGIRSGAIANSANKIVDQHIRSVLDDYSYACSGDYK
jgi:D-tagatose-1,6-bisphosphate aldolase subunit GatZ/KbaZ